MRLKLSSYYVLVAQSLVVPRGQRCDVRHVPEQKISHLKRQMNRLRYKLLLLRSCFCHGINIVAIVGWQRHFGVQLVQVHDGVHVGI